MDDAFDEGLIFDGSKTVPKRFAGNRRHRFPSRQCLYKVVLMLPSDRGVAGEPQGRRRRSCLVKFAQTALTESVQGGGVRRFV